MKLANWVVPFSRTRPSRFEQHVQSYLRDDLLTLTPESNDLRWSLEGVEHDGDPTITWLSQVTDGLVPTTRQIHVPELPVVENSKELAGRATFRRYIYMAFTRQRCCRHPPGLLVVNPLHSAIRDGLVVHSHGQVSMQMVSLRWVM